MKLLFKIFTIIFCLVAAAAILSACLDETLDIGGAIDAGVADSTAPVDTVPDNGTQGSGGSPVTPNPFIKDEYTVKTGVTATEDCLYVLHSCYDENGRLVADVYKSAFLTQYESDLYLTYDYDKNGYLEGWTFYDYRLEELYRVELTLGENGEVLSSAVYEDGEKADELSAVVEYHENGKLKKWEVKYGTDTAWCVEYGDAGNRAREIMDEAEFIPHYGNHNYPISAVYENMSISIDYAETANGWMPCSISLTYGDGDMGEYVITYDGRRNIASVTVLITGVDGSANAEPEAYSRMEASYNSSDRITKISYYYRSDSKWIPEEEYSFTYTNLGQVASEGRIGYNDDGTVSSKQTYAYAYGTNGKVTQTTYTNYDYMDDGSYYKEVSVRKYDADGNVISETDESGFYDKNGKPLKNEGVTESDDAVGTTDISRPGDSIPEGALTPSHVETNSDGNVVKAVFEYKEGDADVKRTNEYDGKGGDFVYPTRVTTERTYFNDGSLDFRTVEVELYDDGNVIERTFSGFWADGTQYIYREYLYATFNGIRCQTKETCIWYNGDGTVHEHYVYEWEYDADGNQTGGTYTEYDADGNVIEQRPLDENGK